MNPNLSYPISLTAQTLSRDLHRVIHKVHLLEGLDDGTCIYSSHWFISREDGGSSRFLSLFPKGSKQITAPWEEGITQEKGENWGKESN